VQVEVGVLKLFQRKLTTQPTPPEVLQETVGKEGAIERRLGSAGPAVEAPAFTLPTGRWTDAESLSRDFNSSRLGLITFIREGSLDLSQYAAPHPIFGPLTGYQWGYFVSLHTDRHVRQIEGLKARPGFPTN